MIKIYIINLNRSHERREFMQEQVSRLKIEHLVEYIDAVDGDSLNSSEYARLTSPDLSRFMIQRELVPGEVGCYLSHMKVYKKIVDENLPFAIIFEDDVTIKDEFLDFLKIINRINSGLDYINFSNFPKSSLFFKKEKIKGTRFSLERHVEGVWGAYGYFITNSGAKKIIKDSLGMVLVPIDYQCRSFGESRLSMRVIYPHIVKTEIPQIQDSKNLHSLINQERKKVEKINFKMNKIKIFLKRLAYTFFSE